MQNAAQVNKKENGSECENAPGPENTGPNGDFQKLMRNRCLGPGILGRAPVSGVVAGPTGAFLRLG
jgi:hypothetical protein